MTKTPPKDGEASPDADRAEAAPSYIGTATAEQRATLQRQNRGNGGDGGGVDARVSKLEAHVEHMQGDVSEIKSVLTNLSAHLHHLPTKQDLTNNILTMVVIGLTVLVLGIGGIVGGLAWLQARDAPPPATPTAPLIFQMPAPIAPATVPVTPKLSPTQPKSSSSH